MFPEPLRSFHKVVQCGSIRKAGEHLNQAPSTISRQIATLERQMGTSLFTRTKGGLILNYAGQLVAKYAQEVILGFDSLRDDLGDLRGGKRRLRVWMVESVIGAGPIMAMERFRTRFPQVSFEFHLALAAEVVSAVVDQRCDIGIGFCGAKEPGITTIAKVIEPLVALVPANHSLANERSLRIEQLLSHPLALPDRDYGIRKTLERICRDLDQKMEPILETNAFETIRAFVRTGMGLGIVPMQAAIMDSHDHRTRCIQIDHDQLSTSTFDIIVAEQMRTPRLVRLFAQELYEAISAKQVALPSPPSAQ